MTRIKKTRTEKSIGAAKKPLLKKSEQLERLAKKKGKGRPAGAKANIDGAKKKSKTHTKSSKATQDRRVGSKTAISLIATPPAAPMEPKVSVKKIKPENVIKPLTPQQELNNIEADERLGELLDMLDDDKAISAADQQYIDRLTSRHQQLLAELGLEDDDESEDEPQSSPAQDIWDRFDNSDLDNYRD
jgi:ribosome assembly protein YihI (activator of Der GTPase)